MYQLEEVNRMSKDSPSRASVDKTDVHKDGMINKLNELSVLLVNEEG